MSRPSFLVGSVCVLLVAILVDQGARLGHAVGEKDSGVAHYQKCAEECRACQRACDSCAAHCGKLLEQGKKEHGTTLATCQDCAAHCSAAASITSRRGPMSDTICKACAEACSRCAKECEKHASHDAEMKRCAEECRRCEQACRTMLTHLNGARTTERTK